MERHLKSYAEIMAHLQMFFDRKKEYLFSYAMNDDITQEIMARCKNVKEILELD